MSQYECSICGYVYDEDEEGTPFDDLGEDWECPVCGASTDFFEEIGDGDAKSENDESEKQGDSDEPTIDTYLKKWQRTSDELEDDLTLIHEVAISGQSVIEPMRSRKPVPSWHSILIKGAQLSRLPLNDDEDVDTKTVIGPQTDHPLDIDTPVFVSHMSFGALSRETKIAMAKGSAAVGSAMCSGEGGIIPESLEAAHRYIFEYVPNRYSVTDENLRAAHAIEIKIGQSAKPGMGGHLPGSKVTEEIAEVRGFPVGTDIISPSRFDDIVDADSLKAKIDWLRKGSGGKPIGVKFAAGHIEADIAIAVQAGADFITIDGHAGGTGAAPKVVKDSTSVPTIYALVRARRCLDELEAHGVSLIITGGLRISADFAKALALGADAIAIASAAMIACGCQQYRICNTDRCPVGIATQDPELRSRFNVDLSAHRLENFLRVSTEELRHFARLTGHRNVHELTTDDLCTTDTEISQSTDIEHAGLPRL